jgi:hypothetical protein
MSPFHQIDVLHEGRIVRIQRSERPYQGAQDLNQERLLLGEALDKLGRQGRALLIDSRAAPRSTDERLEGEFRRFRLEVLEGFAPVAVVVRTKIGILQVNRLVAATASSVQAFDDEGGRDRLSAGVAPLRRSVRTSSALLPGESAPR